MVPPLSSAAAVFEGLLEELLASEELEDELLGLGTVRPGPIIWAEP